MDESNRRVFPKVSHLSAKAGSTNQLAIDAIASASPPAHGAVFWAHEQSAGKGQGSNGWYATPYANLTFSLVTHPFHLPVGRLFALSQVASLAVANTVKAFLPHELRTRVRVKWPNDVYVGDQKIAGILIQNGLRGSRLDWSVIGIGLNVNEVDFPADLSDTAISLRQLTGEEYDLGTVLGLLLQSLSDHYALLDGVKLAELGRRYEELLYRRGLGTVFLHAATGREFTGTIDSVNDAGQLVVRMNGGRFSAFDLREIRLLSALAG